MQTQDGRGITVHFMDPGSMTDEPYSAAQEQAILIAVTRADQYFNRPIFPIHVAVLGNWDLVMASDTDPLALGQHSDCGACTTICGRRTTG